MVIDHSHQAYRNKWKHAGLNKWNGAYYYSREIVGRIIPNVKTDRNWVTVNIPPYGCDHAIVFIHNNLHPERYEWLKKYDDLVLVVGVSETKKKVAHLGKVIYLPLSINVEEVEQYKTEKKHGTAYVGRPAKRRGKELPREIDIIEGLPRNILLKRMAEYESVYAVGRTALEAKALGCTILPYDERYPNPKRWKVLDNLDAAILLQEKLDKIDGKEQNHD